MTRVRPLGILCAVVCVSATAFAQNVPDLAALGQTAQTRYAEWEALASDLGERMARILPCDPRYMAAITEVSQASDARLAALADYLKEAAARAFAETAAAKALLLVEERRALEAALERADAGQEKTAVDTHSDALAISVKERSALEEPQKLLQEIAAMIRQRATTAEQQSGAADAAVSSLRELVTKFDARDAALREESAAFEAERARWNGYYAARRARAQTECSITQIGGAPKSPARPQGKQ